MCELPAAALEVFAVVLRVASMTPLHAGGLTLQERRMGVVVPPVPPLAVPTPTMQPAPPPPDPRCLGLLARRGLAPPAPDPTRPSSGESRAPLQPTGGLRLRRAGALFMPCTPTAADAPSALTAASRHYARARVQALACAGSDDSMALRADVADLTAVGAVIEEFADFG